MRSPLLMNRNDTGLLVIDVQERLMGKIHRGGEVIRNTRLLIQGANLLGLSVYATEQYPKGLGPTVPELNGLLPQKLGKSVFSAGILTEVVEHFRNRGLMKILLAGVEAHVCVQQTALDLLAEGFKVYLASDAVGSRHEEDWLLALRRMEKAGVTLTTSEAALFEWAEKAGTPEFKELSGLVVALDEEKSRSMEEQ